MNYITADPARDLRQYSLVTELEMPFRTHTSGGARFFGCFFFALGAVFAVSAFWPGWSAVWRVAFGGLAILLTKQANALCASITVDASGIDLRRLITSRRVKFVDVESVERRSGDARTGDELIYRPARGPAVIVTPSAYVNERLLRRAMRDATKAAGLRWP